jgi:hypothetical protein
MSEGVEMIPRPCAVTFGVLSQTGIADRIHAKLEILGYVTSDKSLVFTAARPVSVQGEGYFALIMLSMIENGLDAVAFDERHYLLLASKLSRVPGQGQIIMYSSCTHHQNHFLIRAGTPSVTPGLVF